MRRVVRQYRRGGRQQLRARSAFARKLRPLERAAFFKGYAEKKLKNIIQGGSGAFGNAATRLEAFVVKGGTYVYGSYPDIDELFQQQAVELDHKKRDGDPAQDAAARATSGRSTRRSGSWRFINGVGPRVGESGFGLIPRLSPTPRPTRTSR